MLRVDRGFVILALLGVMSPVLCVLFVYVSGDDSVIISGAPWINWATYVTGFSMATVVCGVGSGVMRSKSMLMLAFGCAYWAIGCFVGSLQTGSNAPLAPSVALPYIRTMWLLGSIVMIVASMGVLKRVVRIVPGSGDNHHVE